MRIVIPTFHPDIITCNVTKFAYLKTIFQKNCYHIGGTHLQFWRIKRANSALSRQNTSKAISPFESLKFDQLRYDTIRSTILWAAMIMYLVLIVLGIHLSSPTILNIGANTTYVTDR